MRARRVKRKKQNYTKKIRTIIIVLIFYILLNLIYGIYKENKIRIKNEGELDKFDIQKIIPMETNVENVIVNNEKILGEDLIPDTYENYKVIAQLEIPKIKLETFIFKDYTKKAMDILPTKFFGPEPNDIGNFCITGHNYKKENMFSDLINLDIGDEIYLFDNKKGKFRYTIYDIYKVKPTNTLPLSQETNGKREITLITCVNYANLRLIIKAVER